MYRQNTLVGVALFIGVGLICAFFSALLGAKVGEVAGALGSVIGGIIGALGAAAAVYLTLKVQRDDETEKVCTAIVTEIAQLAKFPVGQLEICRVITQGLQVPRTGLTHFMQTPTPTIYPNSAASVSRLPRPSLVTSFYLGLVETEKTVRVILTNPSPNMFLTPVDVQGLGVLLREQCFLARQILSEPSVPPVRDVDFHRKMIEGIVAMLDAELEAARGVFPTVQEYQQATAPQPAASNPPVAAAPC